MWDKIDHVFQKWCEDYVVINGKLQVRSYTAKIHQVYTIMYHVNYTMKMVSLQQRKQY